MTCRFCANPAHGDADCPPVPSGFGFCSFCMIAAPFADLMTLDIGPRWTTWRPILSGSEILGRPFDGSPDLICESCAHGPNATARRRAAQRHTSRVHPHVNAKPDSTPRVDEALAAFKSGRATDVNSLALALDVSVDRARKQVQRLKRTGLIEVAQGGQRGRPETLRAAGEGWLLPG